MQANIVKQIFTMKKLLPLLFFFLFITSFFAQSDSDIANVYINRATKVIEESIDFKEAKVLFDKALKYMDTIESAKLAKLGARIHFELEDYRTAKTYFQQYFNLVKNKKSEEYADQVSLFVTTNEEIELIEEEERIAEEERVKKEKELRKIDSLKTVWSNAAKKLAIVADSIYSFNANNYALFSNKGKFGVLNDKAEILVEPTEFTFALNYDGFILLQNKEKDPTKIYYFNTNNGSGNLLPIPSDFNPLSTHYGPVMLPRANGRLVTYPNNSFKPLVFDLNQNKIVRVANEEDVLDALKKNDRIRKYNKDGEVKIDKEWYKFGGHLGGGVHPLYFENNYKVHAYLCSIDGKVLFTSSDFDYIGAFYESRLQAIKGNKVYWINQNGTKVSDPKDAMALYTGNSKVIKTEEGVYKIFKDGKIIKGTETLDKLPEFLRKFQ